MHIIALDLDDIKSYQQAHITFTPGTNAIVGQNGAGKSTILEAIGFALFDSLNYRQTEFVREGAKTGTVTVTFASDHDQRVYQVIRRCGAASQYYVHDPELDVRVCDGKVDVTAFLRQHMGVDPGADLAKLFSDAVGVPQGTLTAIFLQTPSQRKGVFDPLLQVEEYRRAYEKLRDPLRTLRDGKQALAVTLEGLRARLERLPELVARVEERRRALVDAQAELTAVDQRLHAAEAQRTAAEAVRQQWVDLQARAAQLNERLASVDAQLAQSRRALDDAAAAELLVNANQAGHALYLAAQERQKELDRQVRRRQGLLATRQELDKTLALRHAELDKVTQDLADVAAAEAAVQALAAAVAQQQQLEEALAAAQQDMARLDGARKVLAEYEQRRDEMRSRLTQLNDRMQQARPIEADRAVAEAQAAELRTAIQAAQEEGAHHHASANAVKEQNSALAEAEGALCPVCEQPLTAEHRAGLLARNEAHLQELRALYREMQQRLKAQQVELAVCDTALRDAEAALRNLPRAEEVAALEQSLNRAEAAVQAAAQQVNELARIPQQAADLRAELERLGNPRQRYLVASEQAKRRSGLEAAQQRIAASLAEAGARLSAMEAELGQFAQVDEQVAEMAAQLQAHAAAYQTVLTHQQLAGTVARRRAELEALTSQREVAVQEQAQVSQDLAAVQARFDADAYRAVLAAEQVLRGQQGGLQAQLAMLAKAQQSDEAEIGALRKVEAELTAAQARLAVLEDHEAVLEALRTVVQQSGPYITRALIGQISEGARQIFSEIMQDYSRHLSWNQEYGISLEVEGRARQFAQLSGGEQMSAALAVRLALLREMSSIDVAFFDEPTTNLDETRRNSLARQILNVRGFRQLFVISHDDTFEQATQNLVRIVRENGFSQVAQA